MYKHPGVYIEHVPSGVLAIEAASTSVAAFIGPVKRGPVGEPVFISNAGQFAAQFGELGAGGGVRNEGASADFFGHAVQAFFANGGTKAYILRVADSGAAAPDPATTVFPDPSDASKGFTVTAANGGTWGDAMIVRLSPSDSASPPDISLGYTFDVGIEVEGDFIAIESFSGVQMATDSPQSIESIVGDGSTLVNIVRSDMTEAEATSNGVEGDLIETNASGQTVIAGTDFDLTVGGTTTTIAFEANTADFGSVADAIQAHVREAITDSPDFTARVQTDSTGSRLILNSGRADGDVVVEAGGTALAPLGLDNVTVKVLPSVADLAGGGEMLAYLNGGDNGDVTPTLAAYQSAYLTLRDYRDVSIMLLPGQHWAEGGDNSIIQSAITHAEFMQNRMVIIDPPDTSVLNDRLTTPKDVKDLGVSTSPYAALYYPWLEVANPYYDVDTAANLPKTFPIPPSGFAAGMWARIDGSRGVWKAPAGLEATVRGAIGPNVLIGNDLQDNLNEFGVNCLRSIIGPTVVWGARTRATKSKPEYRYVPVRRTQNMIGESLYNALQAVVFEPNDHKLWSSLRANVGAFMDTLHRAGAFQGEKASDAYYVQCGLGSTMTQADIDGGVVRVVVGFAPLKPAEFVVVQIKQIVGQTA